ncbi:hypothetical protein PV328_002784 [Microctonus aethiopoides]|uniref:Odorant receptor n=1 Tax=Microctonus aethiopoides TaxID=144406 RepID=A0AA39KJT4_9HYME|nr:hypothetical protein PV328_002784 [Microctonus aethiopoides]
MFAGAQIMHLFFDCYLSQRLADNSSAIEEHIIHSKWNKTSLKTQKLVILVTLRSQQICKLTAGKFVILSMETFGVILGVIVYADDKEIVLESITPFIIDAGMAIKYINAIINMKTVEPLIPKWINFILQSNETIPNKYPVPIYWYIIDMDDNFYSILSYEAICIVAILTITVANDTMFIVFLQHACALFDIAGHQLENLPAENKLEKMEIFNDKSKTINDTQYEYYVMCIKSHKRAIEFANLLEDLYVWSFGLVIALNMPIMSITAVQIVSQADTIQKKIKYSMFTCTQLMHLFFDCYLSQQLTDCSTAIQKHIIYSDWYRISLKSQKLAIMVTLSSQSPCKLTAGKFVELSMETFGVIVKTSVSYFTVMISMR